MALLKRYLIRFANELLSFRLPEFESLTEYFDLRYTFVETPSDKPFFIVETDNEECLLKVLHRSVLAQSLCELWISSTSFEQFFPDLESCHYTSNPSYSNTSFRILVETFGKKISLKTKVEKIEKLAFLPFNGLIDLKNPQVTFHYFEYYGHDANNIPPFPYQILFGRWIADSNRKFVSKFSLSKRKFIANTSMDPTLAFLMSNIAKISRNDLVYDPFVGSGSLLVSAAFYGAYICGTDIDYRLLHGLAKPSRCGVKDRDKDESVFSNLKQYGMQSKYIDVIAADFSLPLLRPGLQFDAIVTDPPYGKRESRERIGTAKKYKIPEELVANHVPSKLEYNIEDIYNDLLNLAVNHLKVNGRILFWAPYTNVSQDEILERKAKQYPEISFFLERPCTELEKELRERFSHPKLKFISYSKQELSCKYCRILIALERIC